MKTCSKCLAEKDAGGFYRRLDGLQSRCKECTKDAALASYRANPSKTYERARVRKMDVPLRTPLWANRAEMVRLYRVSQSLSASTGIPHHVDHIVPIRSRLVCGLHTHTNLQVIPASENMAKGNRSWPNMP